MNSGKIYNIQRFCLQDGQGIRTTLFFKGCPLRCVWCSNPESQSGGQELMYNDKKCLMCGGCAAVCPNKAISTHAGTLKIARERCADCVAPCSKACVTRALDAVSKEYTLDAALEIIDKDAAFYAASGGGVTLSGGEPTAQFGFLERLAHTCKKKGYHTALETCGYYDGAYNRELVEFIDLFLFDIKHADSAKHSKWTGVENERIHKNFAFLAQSGARLIARVPLIPGFNDTAGEIAAIAALVSGHGVKEMNILPYHRLGSVKYARTGRVYGMPPGAELRADAAQAFVGIAAEYGLDVSIG